MNESSRGRYWLAILILIGVLAFYAQRRDLYGLYKAQQESEQRVEALTAQLDEQEQENNLLERRGQLLGADPGELEAESRNTRNLVREGETVYLIQLPEDTPERK